MPPLLSERRTRFIVVHSPKLDRDIQLLEAILEGESYQSVADRFGLTRIKVIDKSTRIIDMVLRPEIMPTRNTHHPFPKNKYRHAYNPIHDEEGWEERDYCFIPRWLTEEDIRAQQEDIEPFLIHLKTSDAYAAKFLK